MEYILKNGIVFDPRNDIHGEQMDILIKNNKIVEKVSSDAKVLDVTDKLVMPDIFWSINSTYSQLWSCYMRM